MTAEELMQMPDEARGYELVDGRLVRIVPTGTGHGTWAMDLGAAVSSFVKPRRLGVVIAAESGFRLNLPGEPDTVLAPDLAFVRANRVPAVDSPEWDGYWRLAPDLIVEVASPSQSRADLGEKARRWLEAGTRLAWLVLPRTRQVEVWRPGHDSPVAVLGVSDSLDGMDVLPGFTYPVAALFSEG
jgi:Uma2 family endonuclease